MSTSTFANAILDAFTTAMTIDNSVICFGLGVTDPKGVFGTTVGLEEKFGEERVFDMPTSENAMTGVAIGASINGLRPILTHQRMDFALLSMDQIVNNAAKWYFMFGGQRSVPITIRMILGRGWGQGPTHSQNLQAWFSHIPGLKVVMPATAYDAKGLLLSSIFDDDPVIFLEHRWLHNLESEVPAQDYRVPIGKAQILCEGAAATVVASSYMTIEALHAVKHLQKQGIECDLIDLRTIKPIDWTTINTSVKKTGRALVLDSGFSTGSISSEIIAQITKSCWNELKCPPERLAMPDYPESTSVALTESYHIRAETIALSLSQMLGAKVETRSLINQRKHPHDVPGDWFVGPF